MHHCMLLPLVAVNFSSARVASSRRGPMVARASKQAGLSSAIVGHSKIASEIEYPWVRHRADEVSNSLIGSKG